LPLTHRDLARAIQAGDKLSYGELHARLYYHAVRYSRRSAVYLRSGEGIEDTTRGDQLWPLLPDTFPRTVLILPFEFALFPSVTPEQLARFDGQNLALVGTLVTRPRQSLFATGHALRVSHIGTARNDGILHWAELAQLREHNQEGGQALP
jgi:hypothetical protein